MIAKAYVTTAEAAKQLHVSLRTIQLWVEKGDLEAWKTPGGHRRISKLSVDRMQHQQLMVLDSVAESHCLVIIEDDPAQQKLYELHFRQWDLPVDIHYADNGFGGLIEIGKYRPHLVITDLRMPGMDGLQMIRELEQNDELSAMKIIVVSSMDEEEARRLSLSPAYTYLEKPIDYEELRALIMNDIDKFNASRAVS